MTPQTSAISTYMKSDEIRAKFAEVLGDRNVGAYISSVMIAVMNSDDLQKCTPQSIYLSALRAATLRLSVDPSLGQAHLVPFKGEATLIPGYKGLLDMAIRTGKYRYVNVSQVYEGEVIEENRISGLHTITGGRTSRDSKVIGWIASFEMMNGYSKTLYMTVEDIHIHAKRWSKVYDNPKSLWQKSPDKMERKTVLRLILSKWGYMDPNDSAVLAEIEGDVIDGQAEEVKDPPLPTEDEKPVEAPGKNGNAPMTIEEALAIKNRLGVAYGDILTEDLKHMALGLSKVPKPTPEQERKLLAIHIIMKDRVANPAQPVE